MTDTSMLLNMENLTFPNGLVGLPDLKHFKLQQSVDMVPVVLMHSVEQDKLSFIVGNPATWFPGYKFDISDEDMQVIKAKKVEDLVILAILNVVSDPFSITANLISPLVINPATQLGVQPVLHKSPYKANHPLSLKTMSVTLKEGLLGIPEWKNFVLQIVDELMPVMLLVSQDESTVSLPVIDPWMIDSEYNPKLSEEDKSKLGNGSENELAWFAILNIKNDPFEVTANLMAPIVINPRTDQARQVLLSKSGYQTTHPIKMFDPAKIQAVK